MTGSKTSRRTHSARTVATEIDEVYDAEAAKISLATPPRQ